MSAEHTRDEGLLLEIIGTVGSTLDLERVLGAIVRLLSELASCHACFVYLDDGAGGLVLRAASPPHSEHVGTIRLAPGEGLVGWVCREREPAFVRDRVLDDPRVVYVPELNEEHFHSMVAVPLLGHDGAAIGAISLHTHRPREFSREESELLIGAASLVAGAVENARLYEEARRRLGVLDGLSQLGEAIARAETLEALLPAVASRTASLIDAAACQIYLIEMPENRLRLRASAPPSAPAPALVSLREPGRRGGELEPVAALEAALFGPDGSGPAALLAPLVSAEELLGFLAARGGGERAFAAEDRDLVASIASQTAVAITKILLIEGLTERNLIKDFFEDLSRGTLAETLAARGQRLGLDLERPHMVVWAAPWASANGDGGGVDELERFEAALARSEPASVCDRRDGGLRGLLPLGSAPAAERDLVARVRAQRAESAPDVVVGLSSPCTGVAALATGFEEAQQAVAAAPAIHDGPAAVAFDDLGPYKYLLRVSLEGQVRDRHADALRRLHDYDRLRRAELVRTLEEYLRQRGNVSTTAQALYVHPNTLRQRLRRITELTGLDVRTDDWLMIEIALKLLKLELALARG